MQSVMCKRCGCDTNFTSKVKKYLTSRKHVKKTIKALKITSGNKNFENPAVVTMLKS